MFLKKFGFLFLFLLSACGFSPLYRSNQEDGVMETELVEVASIPEYNGYVLKQNLINALNPRKKSTVKKYRLEVHLNTPRLSGQSIQGDNFASRKKVALSARYKLIDKETGAVLLSSSTKAIGAFNVFYEPYTTYQAEKKQVEDLVLIVATNISTRVAAYFKKKEVEGEGETVSD